MSKLSCLKRVAALAFTALCCATALAAEPEPLLIGVPLPLTGTLAQSGQLVAKGIRAAADDANKRGGVLGRPIKLLIEDTKSEPNTAAAVATRMQTLDNVYAFVGGFGSTPDFAMLESIKRYKPLFVHITSGSVKLEKAFGGEPWYFHVYIWDYHRQKAVVKFLNTLQPRPKTIAIAYEDGLNGTDAAKYADQYMKPAGFDIVMKEPFKSGSPDFSPLLSRVKALQPDVLFVDGYAVDDIQIARQLSDLKVKPKLVLFVYGGEKRSDFGESGTNLTFTREWAPKMNTQRNKELVAKMLQVFPEVDPPSQSMILGYTGMDTLVQAIESAKTFDKTAVRNALATLTFSTAYGDIGYKKSDGGALHQLLSEDTEIIVQFRKTDEDIVWPADKATGKLVYPIN